MRRFFITSGAYEGQAELLFREDGTLIKIDCSQTDMPMVIMRHFKNTAPAHIDEMEAAFVKTHATIVEASIEVTFEMFWEAYRKKINKKRCEPLWDKLSKVKQVKAFYGISKYDKYLNREGWRSKADPENYIRNEMWDNEYK